MSEPLLTSTEVAALLQIHPKQVYRLLRRGLPGQKVGGEWRFEREAVLGWARGETASAPALAPASARVPAPPRDGDGPPPLVAANGDVAVARLLARVNAAGAPLLGFVPADRDGALTLLERGAVLAAGCHGKGPPARLGAARLARLHLVRRDVGLAWQKGMRKIKLEQLQDFPLAIRPPSAGIRLHLDAALRADGQDIPTALTHAVTYPTHEAVVSAVLRNDATIGLMTAAWAWRAGLRFLKLATEPYGLMLRAAALGDPLGVRLCEAAQSAAFREELREIPGYDPTGAGDIRFDPE